MNNNEITIENRTKSLQFWAVSLAMFAFTVFFSVSLAAGYNKENTHVAIFCLLICIPCLIYALYKVKNSIKSSVSINNDAIEFYSDGTCTARIQCADIQRINLLCNPLRNRITYISWLGQLGCILGFFIFVPLFIAAISFIVILKITHSAVSRRGTPSLFFDSIIIEHEDDLYYIWAPEKVSTTAMLDKLNDISRLHEIEIKKSLLFIPGRTKKKRTN